MTATVAGDRNWYEDAVTPCEREHRRDTRPMIYTAHTGTAVSCSERPLLLGSRLRSVHVGTCLPYSMCAGPAFSEYPVSSPEPCRLPDPVARGFFLLRVLCG